MSNPEPETHILDAAQFNTDITLCFGGDLQKAVDNYCSKINEETREVTKGIYREGFVFGYMANKQCLIWFPNKNPKPCIVAHEALHVAAHVLGALDSPLIDETEEIYAYFIQWLVKEVIAKGAESE